MEDYEKLKNNCLEYSKQKYSLSVLRMADGKNNYKDIAKGLKIHKTKVSSMLKKAEKLGLVYKSKSNLYKKKVGLLGMMPKVDSSKARNLKDIDTIIKKISSQISGSKKVKNKETTGMTINNSLYSYANTKNSELYNTLFLTENILRDLIRKVLSNKDKDNWWKVFVPTEIQKDVENTINKTAYYVTKRKDELEYTHLGQLKEIIINNKNWKDFLPHLKETNKHSFIVVIDRAIPIRNAIGHCIKLMNEDSKEALMRFNDIIKMIK